MRVQVEVSDDRLKFYSRHKGGHVDRVKLSAGRQAGVETRSPDVAI